MQKLIYSENVAGKLLAEVFSEAIINEDGFVHGAMVEVILRGQKIGVAEVVAMQFCPFNRLNDNLSFPITGKNAAHLARVLRLKYGSDHFAPDQRVSILTLRYVERDVLLHADLFKNHWQNIQEKYSKSNTY